MPIGTGIAHGRMQPPFQEALCEWHACLLVDSDRHRCLTGVVWNEFTSRFNVRRCVRVQCKLHGHACALNRSSKSVQSCTTGRTVAAAHAGLPLPAASQPLPLPYSLMGNIAACISAAPRGQALSGMARWLMHSSTEPSSRPPLLNGTSTTCRVPRSSTCMAEVEAAECDPDGDAPVSRM